MTVLVVGATGATGRLLVKQLLDRGNQVKAVVRSADRLPTELKNHKHLTVIERSILDMNDEEVPGLVSDCDAVASCLGHNLTRKGIFGEPKKLVTDTAQRICTAIKENQPSKSVKYVLMNTTGNSNRDLKEHISLGQKMVIQLLRWLLPPHVDNEQAADYLRTKIGQVDPAIEWVAVRPDGLIDQDKVSEYELHASPTRSAIFNADKTSRINVAHFMAELINDTTLWEDWKGQMPVIYNSESD